MIAIASHRKKNNRNALYKLDWQRAKRSSSRCQLTTDRLVACMEGGCLGNNRKQERKTKTSAAAHCAVISRTRESDYAQRICAQRETQREIYGSYSEAAAAAATFIALFLQQQQQHTRFAYCLSRRMQLLSLLFRCYYIHICLCGLFTRLCVRSLSQVFTADALLERTIDRSRNRKHFECVIYCLVGRILYSVYACADCRGAPAMKSIACKRTLPHAYILSTVSVFFFFYFLLEFRYANPINATRSSSTPGFPSLWLLVIRRAVKRQLFHVDCQSVQFWMSSFTITHLLFIVIIFQNVNSSNWLCAYAHWISNISSFFCQLTFQWTCESWIGVSTTHTHGYNRSRNDASYHRATWPRTFPYAGQYLNMEICAHFARERTYIIVVVCRNECSFSNVFVIDWISADSYSHSTFR